MRVGATNRREKSLQFIQSNPIAFHSQLDAWNDRLKAFGLQPETLPELLIVAMPPMHELEAATFDDVAAEEGEDFAAADTALRTRFFSILVVWGVLHCR